MEERHRRLLHKQNPLWAGEKLRTPTFKRDLFNTLGDYLGYKQIIAINGLRRVGKTTLMKQLIEILPESVESNNICYISFDDRDFQKYETADDLINYFMQFSNTGGKRYLFLDEIQKVPDWPHLLKTYYDLGDDLKIIISGSSSIELKKYKETLAGRIITLNLPILTFGEFARYFGMDCKVDIGSANEYDTKILPIKDKYFLLFHEYLVKGAFPELLEIGEADFIKRYISESVVEKVVADLSREIKPERENIVYELLRIFSRNTAQPFEITTLSNALGVNRNIMSRYVGLLEKAFLIKTAYNFTASVVKQVRMSKKAYIAHSSIALSLLDYPPDTVNFEEMNIGHLVESVIMGSLPNASFWRTPQKDEVDIIINGKKPLPIEVKYKNNITRKDMKGILKFMDRFGVNEGIIITKDLFKTEDMKTSKTEDLKTIRYVPAWLFLLADHNPARST
ncbi:MAG: hypothetical protein MSIBF_03515 [Candidatus Altiarchaeales archaeon IMC4]|nr:MAG: hypothetical protein MSIBF_03515 [Candidatus Altiarchaeales archaeon IMC4]